MRGGVLRALLYASVLQLCGAVPSAPALEVHLRLEPDHIILGQPVWIALDITNRSADPVIAEGASNCFGRLNIEIPAAQRRSPDFTACTQGGYHSCVIELLNIAPGQTVTRRYALQGNFITSAAGNYGVIVHTTIRYGEQVSVGAPKLDQSQPVAMSAMLDVAPANPQKLLTIEKSLAQRATTIAVMPSPPPHADVETLRRLDAAERPIERDANMERYALAEGLAAYPAAGMEPIFATWLDRQDFYEYALLALYHLDTPQARTILAQRAAGALVSLPPVDNNAERWLAVEYLSWMGDQSYLPLLEKLVHDPARDVQRMAVFGIGRLGREKDLPLLNQLARNGKTLQDRIDAIQAIGETGSLKAVPILIELFTLQNADEPESSNNALYELTHHEINEAYRSDAARVQQLWQAWWTQNHSTARAYPPVNCDF